MTVLIPRNHSTNPKNVAITSAVLVSASVATIPSTNVGSVGPYNMSLHGPNNDSLHGTYNGLSRNELMDKIVKDLPQHDNPNVSRSHPVGILDAIPPSSGPIFPDLEKLPNDSGFQSLSLVRVNREKPSFPWNPLENDIKKERLEMENIWEPTCDEEPNHKANAMQERLLSVMSMKVDPQAREDFMALREKELNVLRQAIADCRGMADMTQHEINCLLKFISSSIESPFKGDYCPDDGETFRNFPVVAKRLKEVASQVDNDIMTIKSYLYNLTPNKRITTQSPFAKDIAELDVEMKKLSDGFYGKYPEITQLANKAKILESKLSGEDKRYVAEAEMVLRRFASADDRIRRGITTLDCVNRKFPFTWDRLLSMWQFYVKILNYPTDSEAILLYLVQDVKTRRDFVRWLREWNFPETADQFDTYIEKLQPHEGCQMNTALVRGLGQLLLGPDLAIHRGQVGGG